MSERRFELDLASRRVLFRLKVFDKEGEEGYDKKCDALQEELKSVLGEKATVNGFPYMADSMIFKITVPFEKEDESYRIITDVVGKYFPD